MGDTFWVVGSFFGGFLGAFFGGYIAARVAGEQVLSQLTAQVNWLGLEVDALRAEHKVRAIGDVLEQVAKGDSDGRRGEVSG